MCGGNILIKLDSQPKKKENIYVPEDTNKPIFTGVIENIGDWVRDYRKDLSVGTRVFFIQREGKYLEIDDQKYFVFECEDILGTIGQKVSSGGGNGDLD